MLHIFSPAQSCCSSQTPSAYCQCCKKGDGHNEKVVVAERPAEIAMQQGMQTALKSTSRTIPPCQLLHHALWHPHGIGWVNAIKQADATYQSYPNENAPNNRLFAI